MFFRFIIVCVLLSRACFALDFDLKAEAAILMNAKTGKVLFEKNSQNLHYPASTTKLATLLYVIEKKRNVWNFDDLVTAKKEPLNAISSLQKRRANYNITPYWLEVGSSHIGIKLGETLPFKVLLYGMTLPSANDAANVVADYVSGSIYLFTKELNNYLKSIGCKNTNFCNPHGLHHPDHKTTAYDLALIAERALQNSTLMEIASTKRYKRPKTNKQDSTWMANTNQLILEGKKFYYPYALGLKTGSTSDAGYNLVAAAEKGDRKLIAVVMNCKERGDEFSGVINMFNDAFEEKKISRKILSKGTHKGSFNIKGSGTLKISIENDVSIDYYPSEEAHFVGKVILSDMKFPVARGDLVGKIQVIDKESKENIIAVPIFAANNVNKGFFKPYYLLILFAAASIVVYRASRSRRRRR